MQIYIRTYIKVYTPAVSASQEEPLGSLLVTRIWGGGALRDLSKFCSGHEEGNMQFHGSSEGNMQFHGSSFELYFYQRHMPLLPIPRDTSSPHPAPHSPLPSPLPLLPAPQQQHLFACARHIFHGTAVSAVVHGRAKESG